MQTVSPVPELIFHTEKRAGIGHEFMLEEY